jgi:hypothetical protein
MIAIIDNFLKKYNIIKIYLMFFIFFHLIVPSIEYTKYPKIHATDKQILNN